MKLCCCTQLRRNPEDSAVVDAYVVGNDHSEVIVFTVRNIS